MQVLVLKEKTKTRYVDATHLDVAAKVIVETRLRHGWYRDDERGARKAVRLGKFYDYMTRRHNQEHESFELIEIETLPPETQLESRYS